VALAARFEDGRLSARDLTRIIAAGLRGGGEQVGEEEVAAMRTEGGAAGFARIAAELLKATFGAPGDGEAEDGARPRRPQAAEGRRSPGRR
jgi:hypothetical protein